MPTTCSLLAQTYLMIHVETSGRMTGRVAFDSCVQGYHVYKELESYHWGYSDSKTRVWKSSRSLCCSGGYLYCWSEDNRQILSDRTLVCSSHPFQQLISQSCAFFVHIHQVLPSFPAFFEVLLGLFGSVLTSLLAIL